MTSLSTGGWLALIRRVAKLNSARLSKQSLIVCQNYCSLVQRTCPIMLFCFSGLAVCHVKSSRVPSTRRQVLRPGPGPVKHCPTQPTIHQAPESQSPNLASTWPHEPSLEQLAPGARCLDLKGKANVVAYNNFHLCSSWRAFLPIHLGSDTSWDGGCAPNLLPWLQLTSRQ